MKNSWLFILILYAVILPIISCNTSKVAHSAKHKPDWVQQRPVNTQYYIGIGSASKLINPNDYQRVAKKNALDDMMGEIKVSVSSHSVLSQQQNNQQFSQQFFSDTKLISSETLEGFEVLGSWENGQDYWIYYRFSKAEYEAQKRRKLNEAIEKSIDFLNRSEMLTWQSDYTASLKLKFKAAISLQNYLNEAIEADYKGRNVYLMNEIISKIQNQLYAAYLKTSETTFKVSAGKSLVQPVIVAAQVRENDRLGNKIQFLPIQLIGNGLKFRGNNSAETQSNGEAQFILNNIQGANGIRNIQAKIDISKIIGGDSLLPSMRKLLLNLE
ncbi:MAG: LPP20 family lipoprotein, partial [Bacteroidia bacterium]|nr:LPP20 family lipoprotein [Bacteroidia bacterium]